MPLTIVAIIRAHPGQEEFVQAELEKLVAPTLAETGCIQYDLHRDNDDPCLFLFYENWEDRDLWQAHMDSAHLARYKEATEEAVESTVIHEMSRTG